MSDWRKYVRKDYTVAQIAYLAGIMDSDGCFFIGNFSRSKHTSNKFYQTVLTVGNTEKSMIDRLTSDFGGLAGKYTNRQTPTNSRRSVFKWTATGERLEHLCELILSHLTVKKRQCEIMLEMRQTYKVARYKKGHKGALQLDQATLALRERYFNEIRALHARNYLNNK